MAEPECGRNVSKALYRGSQFYWWRKPEYPEKTTINIRILSSDPDDIIYRGRRGRDRMIIGA
jgi:hypothetical protein